MKTHIRHFSYDDSARLHGGSNKGFAGNFTHALHHGCYELVALDEFDKEFTAGVVLKEGEKIFRYKTDRTRIADVKPLIKINVERGLAYFLVEGAETPNFETKSVKIKYMNLVITE